MLQLIQRVLVGPQRNTEMAARGRRPDGCFKPGTAVGEASLQKAGGPSDPPTSSGDGGDVTCCDLLSLRSDSVSLASESNVFRRVSERRRAGALTQTFLSEAGNRKWRAAVGITPARQLHLHELCWVFVSLTIMLHKSVSAETHIM